MIKLNTFYDDVKVTDLEKKEYMINIKAYALLKLLNKSIKNAQDVKKDNKDLCIKMLTICIHQFDYIKEKYNIKFCSERIKKEFDELCNKCNNFKNLYVIAGTIIYNINNFYKHNYFIA